MEISNLTKKRISEYLVEGKRFDKRKPFDHREIKIETGISKNAEGSSRVKFGNTEVIAGVKLEVSEPYTDHEDAGTLITTAEFLPLSSSKYEPGPPKIDAIELARIVDRGIRESGFIDFKKLCIKKGEKVWSVLLDIYSINDDGNLIDVAALATIIALKTAKMPKYNEKQSRVMYGELTNKKIPLADITPITFTFHKIGQNILLDPISEEEESSEARLTITVSDTKEKLINAMQKGNEEPFTFEEINKIVDTAIKKYDFIKEKITV